MSDPYPATPPPAGSTQPPTSDGYQPPSYPPRTSIITPSASVDGDDAHVTDGVTDSTTRSDSDGKADAAKAKVGEVADTARTEVAAVAEDAKASASKVAGTAKHEAASVASETRDQASALLNEAATNLRSQAGTGLEQAAVGLRGVSGELASLADGSQDQGVVADLARQAASRVGSAAEWLGDRDLDGVVHDVKVFARRRPFAFIAIAVGTGVVAGRLARALKDAPSNGATSPEGSSHRALSGGVQADAVDSERVVAADAGSGLGRHAVTADPLTPVAPPAGTPASTGSVGTSEVPPTGAQSAWGTPGSERA